MNNAFIYSLKVWITAVLVGPVLAPFELLLKGEKPVFEILPVVFTIGGLLSLPSFVLLFLIVKYAVNPNARLLYIKYQITVVGIILTYVPFLTLYNNFRPLLDGAARHMFICYLTVIICSIWLYKLKQIPKEEVISPITPSHSH